MYCEKCGSPVDKDGSCAKCRGSYVKTTSALKGSLVRGGGAAPKTQPEVNATAPLIDLPQKASNAGPYVKSSEKASTTEHTRNHMVMALFAIFLFLIALVVALFVLNPQWLVPQQTVNPDTQAEPTDAYIPSTPTMPPATQPSKEDLDYEAAVRYCEQLEEQKDYVAIVGYLRGLAKENSRYDDLILKYVPLLVEATLDKAKEYADKRDFAQAIKTITNAETVHTCSSFTEAEEYYQSCLPCSLSDIHIIASEEVIAGMSATDCFGNEYENIIGGHTPSSYKTSYAVFYLDSRFCNLSGIFIGANTISNEGKVVCTIFADGRKVFTSPQIGRTDSAVKIDIDVTGVEQLRVEFSGYSGAWPYATSLILSANVY